MGNQNLSLNCRSTTILIFHCGVCSADDKELSRNKKDVSSIKNLASSLVGDKFNHYPTGDNNWNQRYSPFNKFPSGSPGFGYHGSFGGSYVGTYERGVGGGYVYDRPQQGGQWFKPTYPTVDDTVVVYPFRGTTASFPTGPSSPGFIEPVRQPAYRAPPPSPPSTAYLPVSAAPTFYTSPAARPSVAEVHQPVPAPIPAPRPAVNSVQVTGQYLPATATGFGISTNSVSQPFPVVQSRPVFTSVSGSQPAPPVISSAQVPVFPVRSAPPVSVQSFPPVLPPAPQYNPLPLPSGPSINSVDTSFGGYHYDKPEIPFF
ncbi:uncharacterized protein isoform X1 [Rhodnius prolixus]|uniref:uncharacterized protein isoform X1 n=1 Tax=Rhodnius prolixus TaxID=13249 RepID=UPI003D18F1DB